MRGVGTPTASQKMENWPPSSTSNSFTGGTVITGAARQEIVKELLLFHIFFAMCLH